MQLARTPSTRHQGHNALVQKPAGNRIRVSELSLVSVSHRSRSSHLNITTPAAASPTSNNETGETAWDPEGILPPPPSGGHFARRDRERAAQLAQQDTSRFRQVPPELLAAHPEGIPAADGSLYDKVAYKKELKENFIPVDLDYPGLRIQHFDPPVLTIDTFFTPDQCTQMINGALNTGRMTKSKIGAGNAAASYANNTYSERRTSTSIVVDKTVTTIYPDLKESAKRLQTAGQNLLPTESSWGPSGKLPPPGKYCYESLQVAKYEKGEHFLSHEDGFPVPLSLENGFQRRATLLVYLNDVPEGGATAFDALNLAVRPAVGKALLFFPAFADGTPDDRTLHTAEDAVDTKWVTQQWVACGVGSTSSSTRSGGKDEDEDDVAELALVGKRKGKKGAGKKAAPAAKGFGAK